MVTYRSAYPTVGPLISNSQLHRKVEAGDLQSLESCRPSMKSMKAMYCRPNMKKYAVLLLFFLAAKCCNKGYNIM